MGLAKGNPLFRDRRLLTHLTPRADCAEGAMPSLLRKLHIAENVRGPSTCVRA